MKVYEINLIKQFIKAKELYKLIYHRRKALTPSFKNGAVNHRNVGDYNAYFGNERILEHTRLPKIERISNLKKLVKTGKIYLSLKDDVLIQEIKNFNRTKIVPSKVDAFDWDD